ncbi:MAG TPA: ankyrin repeat domain-containing protein [Candidatus Bathyarchaeia archaeon]|nr:ankyrin repeat domain-containing protein [Candidatus Bathyarchaeia archaeon]
MSEETNEQLFESTRKNDLEGVKEAIELGAYIDAQSEWEGTALHIASSKGFIEIVSFLLEAKADSTILDKVDFTPLHLAARDGQVKIVQLLLEKGGTYTDRILADVGAVASMSVTSNPIVSDMIRRQRIKQLEPSVENHKQEDKLLFEAVFKGDIKGIENALEKGANINSKDDRDLSILRWAVRRNHEDIVKLLLEKNVEINAVSNMGWTALMEACMGGINILVKLLIANGADVNIKTTVNATALYFAAYEGYLDIVKLLLKNGADPSVVVDTSSFDDESFETPITIAIKKGHMEIVELLEDTLNKK